MYTRNMNKRNAKEIVIEYIGRNGMPYRIGGFKNINEAQMSALRRFTDGKLSEHNPSVDYYINGEFIESVHWHKFTHRSGYYACNAASHPAQDE